MNSLGQRIDPEITQRQAADPDVSAWVAASAGAGKTKVLTDRILRLMLDGTPPQHILCLTFTRAAAAEMANRLRRRLGVWATAPEAGLDVNLAALTGRDSDPETRIMARRLLARVLDSPGGMRIQTIHAFCESLLGRFPIEAGLSPHFEVMDERTAAEVMAEAQDDVLQRGRAPGEPELAAALAEVTSHVHQAKFPDLIAGLVGDRARLARLFDRAGGSEAVVGTLRSTLGLGAEETPDSVIAEACRDAACDVPALVAASGALLGGTEAEKRRGRVIAEWLEAATGRVAQFDEYMLAFLTQDGGARKHLITAKTAVAAPAAREALEREAARLVAALERRNKAIVARASAALLALGRALLDAYETRKLARAKLDYDDLILRARDLLRRPGVASWVLYKLDGGLDHILIDEAQDTNPEQWQVIEALAEEFFAGEGVRDAARTVFAVGDAKQSIYSFQRADPEAFAAMRQHFADRVGGSGNKWRNVDLEMSFRSTPEVLRAVDGVFAQDLARDGVAFDDTPIRHLPYRDQAPGLVEIWPPVPAPVPETLPPWRLPVAEVGGKSARLRLAGRVAAKIKALCDGSQWLETEDEERPIRPGDIMVLVRRRGGFVHELVRALKDRGVGVAGVDRMVLTDHIAVMDLMALGRFLLMPEDDLSLAEVLKSPLCGLDDDDLFALAHRRPAPLWRMLGDRQDTVPGYGAAATLLGALLARADQVPPYELYAELLDARGGRRALLARLGPDAAEPIDEFLAQALAYQRRHVPTLQGFLHWLEAGAVEVRRDMDQGGHDAVRVMTVHGAKGLEAPIVFLPDTMQTPTHVPPLLWTEDGGCLLWPPKRDHVDPVCAGLRAAAVARRDREHRRLLYVAMTRAADRLYVCGWRTRREAPADCWYNLIVGSLRDRVEEVSDSVVADRPVLRIGAPASPGGSAIGDPSPERLEGLPSWALKRPDPEPDPPTPLVPSAPGVAEPQSRSPLGAENRDAARRGRAVHRLLQILPDLAPARRDAACRRFLARPALGFDRAMSADITRITLAVLNDPAFGPVFAPGSRAEVSIAGIVRGASGQRVLSGRIDRLAVTENEVLVVDFKTGRAPPPGTGGAPAAYVRQMAAYRAALRQIYPTRPIRCALLWTDQPRLDELASAALDAAMP